MNLHSIESPRVKFIEFLRQKFPAFSKNDFALDTLIADNLLSPFQVKLTEDIIKQAKSVIEICHELRSNKEYQRDLFLQYPYFQEFNPGNHAIATSFDFHLDGNQNLKLIEVNTNAAFLVLGDLMYNFWNLPNPVSSFSSSDLQSCILEELRDYGNHTLSPRISILDEQPQSQRLFIEFLVYQQIFESFGWNCNIEDVQSFSGKCDFVYNRYTDFYLTKSISKKILESYKTKQFCLSPHPLEYFLLADKQRLVDWTQDNFLEKYLPGDKAKTLRGFLPMAVELKNENKEELWEKRKKMFFKPKNEFGSKKSFKGASISRKLFDEMANENSLAQEYISATEVSYGESESLKFKYDLRFYSYKSSTQLGVCRLYQGQVTNLRTPLGGFAAITLSE